jgi:hypothetical protein
MGSIQKKGIIIIKDNAQLLDVLEKVKAMESVEDTIWSEIVEGVRRKRSIPNKIINQL